MLYEEQNIYLNALLHRQETKKASGHPQKVHPTGKKIGRPPAEDSFFSFLHSLQNDKGINVHICQKAFCDLHGFGPKRLQILRCKLRQGPELEPDKHGKHGTHCSVAEDVKKLVREHIETFPSRHSHYCRKDNIERVYLSSDLSIARLYCDSLEKHDPDFLTLEEENRKRVVAHESVDILRKPLISEHMYHGIFVTEYNIHFGYPRTDTCSTCDNLTMQIQAASAESKLVSEESLQAHQQLAKEGYAAFKYDRQLSLKSWKN